MRLLWLVLVAGCTCGAGHSLDTCIEDRVTITDGIYGQLRGGCDTPDCTPQYATGTEVRVYDEDPTPEGGEPGSPPYDTGTTIEPIAHVTAGDLGFYEVGLARGTYFVCTGLCVQLPMKEPLVREDWTSGPGGGLWVVGVCD